MQPAFTRRELGSIPRRPTPCGVGVKVTQQALTLIEASSILVPRTSSLQRPMARHPASEAGDEGSTPSAASEKTWNRSSCSMKTRRDHEDNVSSRPRATDGAVTSATLSIIPGQHEGHARVCFTQRSRFDSFLRSPWYVSSVAEQGPVRPAEEGSIPSRIATLVRSRTITVS
jgi:hypothetical protein